LYSCNFLVSEDAAFGEGTIFNTNLGVAPRGDTDGTDCLVDIVSPTPTATEAPPCVDDSECPTAQVCVEGTCFARTPTPTPTPIGFCREDVDCDPGDVCVDDRCTPRTPTATRTATPVGVCTDDSDCPDREVCSDGTCTRFTPTATATPIDFCRDDADCPNGEVCASSQCARRTPTQPPPASTSTATQTRTPEGFCVEEGDCRVGQVCEGNICVAPDEGDNDSGCQITPNGPSDDRAFLLAWLIPALVLLGRGQAQRLWFPRHANTERQRHEPT
jgi:Cys-rich repeat protein